MNDMSKHSQPATGSRRDHLWVLVIIAGFALFDVWEAWSEVGNKSGFAHGTGWTLTVIVEAFAGYCLFAWFDAPGARSRRFAMWSAITALTLSMIGQGASVLAAHTMPPLWLMVFVRILPVIVLALIAVLVHLRRLDREDGERGQAALERAEADERAALRAEVVRLRGDLETAAAGLESAHGETSAALARAVKAEQKIAGATARKSAPKPRVRAKENAQRGAQDEDLSLEMRALNELLADPALRQPRMGGELARRLQVSPATGRRLHGKLTAQDLPDGSLSERSE